MKRSVSKSELKKAPGRRNPEECPECLYQMDLSR
jgi:hypothetical protein